MSRDIEPRADVDAQAPIRHTTRGTVTPYHGDDDVDPMSYHVPPTHYEAWEWVSLRPVEYTKIDEVWSKWITPLRAPALAWLWITYRWHRVAILLATIAAVILTFKLS